MNERIRNIFKREPVTSIREIYNWWMKGLGLLNLFYLLYVIFHLIIVATVFQNGLILFLLPVILGLGIVINIIYISGFITEITLSKVFRLAIDFDKSGPKLKEWLMIISVTLVLLCSVYNILNPWQTFFK